MFDAKQLKAQGIHYARSLQTAVKVALTFTTNHPNCVAPTRHSFDRLNILLKAVGQFTIGFLDRQVLINQVLTIEPSLAHLENDFLKRGIGAITFEPGLSLARYQQVIAVLTTPLAVIAEQGGTRAFLERNVIEGVRILPAPKNQRRNEDGDTILETDSESYLLSRNVDPNSPDVMDSMDILLRSTALEKAGSAATAAEEGTVAGGTSAGGADGEVLFGTATLGTPGSSGGVSLGRGNHGDSAGDDGPDTPAGLEDLGYSAATRGGHSFVAFADTLVQKALLDNTADVERSYLALARTLRDANVDAVLARFPQERQVELRALAPKELAAEFFEETALTWAAKRFAAAPQGSDKFLVEEEVVRVLARTVRATQMADRLAAKLVKYVEEHTLPRNVYERVQEELRWTSLTFAQKQARLLKIERFDGLQFRRLKEHIKDLLGEGDEPHASEMALHYLQFLRLEANEIRPEELGRLPELMRIMPVSRKTFVPAALESLSAAVLRPNVPQFLHFQLVNALTVLSQSIAVYEDFEQVLAIGSCLEHASAEKPEAHSRCCMRALSALLPAATLERVIELYLVRRDEPGWTRMATVLLRWSGPTGIEKAFQCLDAEANAKNRLALLRLIGKIGPGAVGFAQQRLRDERWYVVRNAILLLGELPGAELLEPLSAVLTHADPRVQQTAVSVLIKKRVEGRARAFAEVVSELHPTVIEQVLDELLYIHDPETASAVQSFVFNSHAGIEPLKKALRILAAMPVESSAESLRKVVADPTLPAPIRELALSLTGGDSPPTVPNATQKSAAP